MRLGINAVRLTRQFTGVGRYLECLLGHWALAGSPFDEILLYAPRELRLDLAEVPSERFVTRVVGAAAPDPIWEWRWLRTAHAETDVLFCPSYTVPLDYPGRCVVTYHGPAYNDGFSYQGLRAAAYDRLYCYSARRADHVFTNSEVVRKRVIETYRVHPQRVSVAYMAASDRFYPVPNGPERDEVVRRLTGLGSEPYFLFVGKLSGRHFIPELLEGFVQAIRAGRLPHRLVMAGPDVLGYDVPARARRLGAESRIHWLPFVPHQNLPFLYSAAQAFVFPVCEAEGFGIPVLEAMACGAPVLSVAQGSIREFAAGSALLVDEPDRHSIADGLLRLANDPTLRRNLCERGLVTARSITWAHTADKTMAKLWEIASRG